jgi:alpha-N-arabinofuranosidase
MYQPFMGATPYPAHVSSPTYGFEGKSMPAVDVSAAKGKDGKIYLALVNSDPNKAVHVVTNLPGIGKGRILAGATMDAHNTFAAPHTVEPVSYSGSSDNGKASFDLPGGAVAVVALATQ